MNDNRENCEEIVKFEKGLSDRKHLSYNNNIPKGMVLLVAGRTNISEATPDFVEILWGKNGEIVGGRKYTMSGINFENVSEIFRNHLLGTQKCRQYDFLEAICPEFIKDRQVNGVLIDPKWVSSFYTGTRAEWKELGETYSEPENQELFRQHVHALLHNCRVSSEQLRKELDALVEEDDLLSDTEKQTIRAIPSPEDFAAEVLLRSILQPNRRKVQGMLQNAIKNQYPRDPCPEATGREKEIEELHRLLEENRHVFLTGVAGIGKSELARIYRRRYEKCYNQIININSCGDLRKDLEYYGLAIPDSKGKVNRKFCAVSSIPRGTIIMIDNFNEEYQNSGLDELLKCPCTILVTTRCRYADVVSMNLEELPQEDQIQMMRNHLDGFPVGEELLKKISNIMNGHTLTLCLVARMIRKGIRSAWELYILLKKDILLTAVADRLEFRKDGQLYRERYYKHLQILFKLMGLSESHRKILSAMVLMPRNGIQKLYFRGGMNLATVDEIDDLIELGLIRSEKDGEINLYPLIGDFAAHEIPPTVSQVEELLVWMQRRGLACGIDDSEPEKFHEIIKRVIKIAEKDNMDLYKNFLINTMGHAEQYHDMDLLKQEVQELAEILKDQTLGNKRDREILQDYQLVLLPKEAKSEVLRTLLQDEKIESLEDIYTSVTRHNQMAGQYLDEQKWNDAIEQLQICLDLLEKDLKIRSEQTGSIASHYHMSLDILVNFVGTYVIRARAQNDYDLVDQVAVYVNKIEELLQDLEQNEKRNGFTSYQYKFPAYLVLMLYYYYRGDLVRGKEINNKVTNDMEYYPPELRAMAEEMLEVTS